MSNVEPEQTDRVIRFMFLGQPYELRPDEVPIAMETECRQETGITPMFVYNHDRAQFGRDIIACLLWLCRRQAGTPTVVQIGRKSLRLWDEVCQQVSWEAMGTLQWGEDTEAPADPETPAGL